VEAVNGPHFEWDPLLTSDGLTLYFSSDRPGGVGSFDTYVTTRPTVDSPFGAPAPVAHPGWNTASVEGRVTLRSDGLEVILSSNRDDDEFRLWRSTREDPGDPFTTWTTVPMTASATEPHFNTYGGDLYISTNNDLAVLHRDALDKPFGPAKPLDELNSGAPEISPTLSKDQLTILFVRSTGSLDIFAAYRENISDDFKDVHPLESVNTEFHEAEIFLAEYGDSCELFFSSNREAEENWNLYRARIVED